MLVGKEKKLAPVLKKYSTYLLAVNCLGEPVVCIMVYEPWYYYQHY